MSTSPYMALNLPTPSGTQGPLWATELNDALTLVDSHNHTTGQGVQIPSAGMNINADLPFGGYNATLLRSTRFSSQSSVLALSADIACAYVSGGDLYYNNNSGTPVQITAGSALAATSLGGISGLAGTSGSVTYNSGAGTFTFLQATGVAGFMDTGAISLHPTGTSTNAITLTAPASLSPPYTLTLPTVVPATNALLVMSTSGVLSTLTASAVSASALTLGGAVTLNGTATLNAQVNITTALTIGASTTVFNGATLNTLQSTSANSALALQGNKDAADAGSEVDFKTTNNRSAGYITRTMNNGLVRQASDYRGWIQFPAQINPASTEALSNTITPKSFLKAWGHITTDGGTGIFVADGINIASVSCSGNLATITLQSAMANTSYAVVLTGGQIVGLGYIFLAEKTSVRTTTTFQVTSMYWNGTTGVNAGNFSGQTNDFTVAVYGTQ